LSNDVYNEFEEIVTNILTPEPNYLINLYQLKIYQDDLINTHTRYGVFQTNNFIIKIDDQSDIFASELEFTYRIGKGIIYPYNIVLPYYVHIAKKNKDKNRKKIKIMHFSIQPRIKNTIALHKWINLSDNRFYNITYYVKMCITISKSILFIHSHNLVHGDIKPDNILIELSSNTPYIIDFGLSGIHALSQGTGGTRPFCSPETNNTSDNKENTYIWTKNNKQHDLWSIAFIFSTIIIFKKSYNYYSDYPHNYFTDNKYINLQFLNRIPLQFREPFVLVLSKKSDINLSNFISLLEHALTLPSLPDLHYPSHYHLDAPTLV
jgi:serine/threonine protein kinase